MSGLVIFDFDKTLTTRDTLRPFVNYVTGKPDGLAKRVAFYFLFIKYRLGLMEDRPFKEAFLGLFVKGLDEAAVRNIVEGFIRDILPGIMKTDVYAELQRQVTGGARVYLASANFDFFLSPLMEPWHLAGIISTETERQEGLFTGKIYGPTCKGENKVAKIKAVLGEGALKAATAYGDDEDGPLLRSVGRGIKV